MLPKREVIRRTRLEPATLTALIRSGAFPSPILNGRWDPAAVDRWVTDTERQVRSVGGALEGEV